MSTFEAGSSPSNAALAGGAAAPLGQRTGKWAAVALAVGMVTAGLLFCGIVGLCVLGVLYTLRRRPA